MERRRGLRLVRRNEPFESSERFRADMVLNAFGIHFRYTFGDAYGTQKGHNRLVSHLRGVGQFASFIREKNGSVWLGCDESAFLQSHNRAINGHMGNSKPFGEVHYARLAHFRNQIRDSFHVIFRSLVGVLAPGLRQIFRLAFCVEAAGRPTI